MNLVTGFEYSRAYGQFYVPVTYKCPPQAKIFKDFSTQNVLEAICQLRQISVSVFILFRGLGFGDKRSKVS